MANPSLQIGDSNWAIKEDNLLGYSTAGTRFVPQPITMTRASAGTRVNSSGLVETVELLGSELITNEDFESDTSGWSAYYSGTLNNTGNALNVVDAGAGGARASTSITTVIGKTYKFVSDVLQVQSANTIIAVSNAINLDGAFINSTITTPTNGVTVYFTATATTTFIGFKRGGGGVGVTNIYDNVSVKESTRNNLARVDYDGTASSLLVEPERRNLVTNSEEFLTLSNTTLSNTISPDGTLNGLKINETTSNSQHYGTSYESSVVSGTIYAVSFYIKKGTYDLVKVYTQSSRISASISITFSTESTSPSGSDFISGSNFMEDAGNGWYRVGFSATANSTGAVSVYLTPNDLTAYVGDTSQYTEYWGVQIEEGSYATSYIPTDGSTVTRVQDQYSKTGISNLINSEEGVLFIEMAALSDDGTNRGLSLSDGTSSNRILIYYTPTSNQVVGLYTYGGSTQVNITNILSDSTEFIKCAFKFKENDCAFWVNGVEVGTDTSSTAFSANTLNDLGFDSGAGGSDFYGKVKQLQVFKTALTDTELATLTTI